MRTQQDDRDELSIAAACYGGDVCMMQMLVPDSGRWTPERFVSQVADYMEAGIKRWQRQNDLPAVRDTRWGAASMDGHTLVYVYAWCAATKSQPL